MKRINDLFGWLISAFMVITLSVVCIVQWKQTRNEREKIFKDISDIGIKYDLNSIQLNALMSSIDKDRVVLKEITSSFKLLKLEPGTKFTTDLNNEPEDKINNNNDGDISLPSLPEGINSEYIVGQELKEITRNQLLNPNNKKLNSIEAAKAQCELTRAQGILKTLDMEIWVEVTKGMEILRQSGSYIEYADGDKYQTIPGVKTAAEKINGGIRMFYLYPEQFNGIYDKENEKKEIAEICTKGLIAIFSEKS